MIIDKPASHQIPALRGLWKEAFGDTDAFLDDFMSTAMNEDRCRCISISGQPVAALYWLDASYSGKPVAYLYAVATAKAHRGKGFCRALMEDTHQHLRSQGYVGTILVPWSEALVQMYMGMGYRVCSSIKEFPCTAGAEAVQLYQVDTQEYAARRRQLLPVGGVIQENENLDFLKTQVQLYAGEGFLLAARTEGDMLYGVELLGDTTAAPGILRALGCARGTFRTPGEGSPFAMYRPLTAHGLPAPAYFGIAFD